jgi:transcription antitermination factor NusG
VPQGVGDAVGVGKSVWYVALVNNNTEKMTGERLSALGYENYVATQLEIRVWRNGKRAKVDRVVIPSTVFVKCTEKERRQIVALPYINRFMTNKAAVTDEQPYRKPLAIIPNRQIETLRFMLGNSDTPVNIGRYQKGDKVRVARGELCGLEGEVIETSDGKSELIVAIDFFGCARLTIDRINLEPIK